MQTSCHFTYPRQAPGRVIISRGTPRGTPAGYRKFMDLAPSRDTLHIDDYDRYRAAFMAELYRLDPQQTWDRVHALVGTAEPVLLCYERPPLSRSNFCHRRMVADWFRETLGYDVPEWSPAGTQGGLL